MLYFYCADGTNVEGPIPENALKDLYTGGRLPADTKVCPEGSSDWIDIQAACRAFVRPPPPPAPSSQPQQSSVAPPVQPPRPRTRRWMRFVIAGVIAHFIAYALTMRSNATLGYHLVGSLLPLVSYSVILALLALVVGALLSRSIQHGFDRQGFRSKVFSVFGWLFLLAMSFDLLVASYRVFVVEPRVRAALERFSQ